jgi:hypothetical protein
LHVRCALIAALTLWHQHQRRQRRKILMRGLTALGAMPRPDRGDVLTDY